MKILADEGVDGPIVEQLRQDGHQVLYVAEMAPSLPDDEVLLLATNEGAVLLTADKDFGELIFRQRRLSPGIILLRLAGIAPVNKAILVSTVVAERSNDLVNAFTVVTPKTIRIRR